MKYLSTKKTNSDLVSDAIAINKSKQEGNIPVLHGIRFENAFKGGWCQQTIRKLIEGTVYGKEWTWGDSSCCATSTYQRLVHNEYPKIPLMQSKAGDLIYISGGPKCRTCKQPVGHVVMKTSEGQFFQNTSRDNLCICIVPLTNDQRKRVLGVFRLLPLASQQIAALEDFKDLPEVV